MQVVPDSDELLLRLPRPSRELLLQPGSKLPWPANGYFYGGQRQDDLRDDGMRVVEVANSHTVGVEYRSPFIA